MFGDANERTEIKVTVDTLDEMLEREAAVPSLIKCDTQGSEYDIVLGGLTTLERDRAVWLFELWPAGLAQMGASPRELLGLFVDRDYLLFEVLDDDERLLDVTTEELMEVCASHYPSDVDWFTNVLAIPRDSPRLEVARRIVRDSRR